VDVQIEARSKALAEGDGCGFGPLVAERSGLLALPALDLLDEDAADGRQRLGVCGEQQAEFERDGQDSLPQGEVGSDDMVDQVRGRA
jgi:hypothetical protein